MVYVIDNHPLYREAVCILLRKQHSKLQIVQFHDLSQLYVAINSYENPRLIIFGCNFTEEIGILKIEFIKQMYPITLLAVLSESVQKSLKEKCFNLGVTEYIEKSYAAKDMGAIFADLILQAYFLKRLTVHTLTKRQLQILQLVEKGLSNVSIAKEIGVSLPTVKVHLNRLYSALNVNNRLQAVFHAKNYCPMLATPSSLCATKQAILSVAFVDTLL